MESPMTLQKGLAPTHLCAGGRGAQVRMAASPEFSLGPQ